GGTGLPEASPRCGPRLPGASSRRRGAWSRGGPGRSPGISSPLIITQGSGGGTPPARPCDGGVLGISFARMKALTSLRWALVGTLGKAFLWLWAKTARIEVSGDEAYRALRRERKPVILLVW